MAVNILQACFTGLDGDEAYYWTYAQHLQWGYFDHPPMVALTIKFGEWFGHGPFFTRAGTVFLSAATIYFGFKALPDPIQKTKPYILVFASVVLFHIYGFIVTPDPSLLFFTALFFYAYQLYLREEKLSTILFLSFSIVGLLYSKYHGVLAVFFTFLSNPRLILKRSAWMIAAIVVLTFLPHLVWQYQHDFPTIRYHLFERNRENYKIEKTTNYILGQILIWGPFSTIVFFIFFFKSKWTFDRYLRAHLFTFLGVLGFFLLSSFKKNVEPHWTLVSGISFVVLIMQLLNQSSQNFQKIFLRLCMADIILLIAARLMIVIPNSPAKNIDRFHVQIFSHAWSDSVFKYAAGTPLVFIDNYTHPSLYKYYHPDQLSECFSSVYYRKNNFNLQNEEPFNNKTVYVARSVRMTNDDIEIKSHYETTFLHKLDSFKAITGLKIKWLNKADHFKAGQNIKAQLELSNPLSYTVSGNHLFLNYSFSKSKKEVKMSDNILLNEKELQPGFKKKISIDLQLPARGKYRLIFSFSQQYVGPTFSSPFYDVEVQ